jgi:hypothetical protein
MPTGYTCIIEDKDGTTFREYALRCARAFGACIMQRDDDSNEPPKPRLPDQRYVESLAKAERDLRELESSTPASFYAKWRTEVMEVDRRNAEYRREHAVKAARYAKMRAQVEAWSPPTLEHRGLKEFMLGQIDVSHRADEEPYQAHVAESEEAYRLEQLELARDRVASLRQRVAEDAESANKSTDWLTRLEASLPR